MTSTELNRSPALNMEFLRRNPSAEQGIVVGRNNRRDGAILLYWEAGDQDRVLGQEHTNGRLPQENGRRADANKHLVTVHDTTAIFSDPDFIRNNRSNIGKTPHIIENSLGFAGTALNGILLAASVDAHMEGSYKIAQVTPNGKGAYSGLKTGKIRDIKPGTGVAVYSSLEPDSSLIAAVPNPLEVETGEDLPATAERYRTLIGEGIGRISVAAVSVNLHSGAVTSYAA